MHFTHRFVSLISVAAIMAIASSLASANEVVTCKSDGYKYTHCNTISPGYVTLKKQLSSTSCIQGSTWDYDRRGVWVDDGCKGEFLVETGSGNKSSSKDAAAVAGVLIGVAILGALISDSNNNDEEKYDDKDYKGSRHTSYVPDWMIGKFEGYNPSSSVNVKMEINKNGRVLARVGGNKLKGWINDERLHIGDAVFDIERSRRGFVTSMKGDPYNEVRYHRVD